MSSKTPETAADFGFVRRFWRRTGVRVLTLQAVALVLAFAVAGALASVSIRQISDRAYRADVMGEVASLNDEAQHKGVGHLPFTVAKRSRLWHGFEYGLAGPGGTSLAGGGWLTVGHDLSAEQSQMRDLAVLLSLCGAAGVLICLATAYLTTRWT